MDEKKLESEHSERGEDTPSQEANVMHQHQSQPNQMIVGGSSSSCYPRGQLYPHQYIHQLQNQALQTQLQIFWKAQFEEIENTIHFNHALPLARIKKIMKSDDDVKMIAAEAPILLSKACEMFIMELTTRAWVNAEENRRRTLQKSDIASAISRTEVFDFLIDIVPRDETMEHELCVGIPPRRGNAAEVVQNIPPPPPHPYYYVPSPPPQHFSAAIPPRMVMARPPFDHPIHRQQLSNPYAPQVLQYPIPKHLMLKRSPDSNETTK